ncbi:MAG: NOL1/NOP2/sun family putative RNA methylase [Nanobdellota archaeon]
MFKQKFIERYSQLTDFEAFKEASLSYPRKSIRVNTLKISVAEVKERLEKHWTLTPIPWCEEGFWVEHHEGRRDVGNLIEHALGYIYIQDAASMIPPLVLGVTPGDLVLDMCASPGSKSSQIASMLKGKGFLVSNDYKGMRLAPLGLNLQRVGAHNVLINLSEGRFFKDVLFDKILVDAPCSGTGTIRKSQKTMQMWNPNMIRRLAGTQRQLLVTAFNCLKPGGCLVYSTCSCEPEEDEAVVSYLVENYPAVVEEIELPLARGEPVLAFEGKRFSPEVKKTLRIWPQDNDTEGFFVARIRKR